jgi:hypothetical protein
MPMLSNIPYENVCEYSGKPLRILVEGLPPVPFWVGQSDFVLSLFSDYHHQQSSILKITNEPIGSPRPPRQGAMEIS